MTTVSDHLFRKLRRETRFGPVIIPSAGIYRSIFAWDSGWNSFWLRTLGDDKAAAELKTLFSTAGTDGMIPHETAFDNSGNYNLVRKLQLRLLRNTFDEQGSSFFIDPPVYLWAAADLLDSSESLSSDEATFFRKTVDANFDWLSVNRTIEGLPEPFCRLPVLLHPFESGTDLSPAFDAMYGGFPHLLFSILSIQKRMSKDDWKLRNITPKRPARLIFDLTYLSFYLKALEKFGRFDKEFSKDFFDNFYNPTLQSFDNWYLKKGRLIRLSNSTFSSVLPFLTDTADEEISREAIARHCVKDGTFWKGRLPDYNASTKSRRSIHLWRGSCSWMNMNYCNYLLLKKYGFDEDAQILADTLKSTVREALPEYFDSFTLEQGGADHFSWNGLVDCMK